jgi:endonuclease/exonuclease/phosphatase family metal-dependent hydrolase
MPADVQRFSRNSFPTVSFRVMTYNVHRCRGLDGAWSPERIAAVIASTHPDIVALQELDVGRARSGHIDQAETIARDLGMDVQFFPALRVMDELYGDAILSRWPAQTVRAAALPALRIPGLEPRGALWAQIQVDGVRVQVINTHLSLFGRERLLQIKALTGPEWLRHPQCRGPVLVMGDMNATPRSKTYRQLSGYLADAFLINRKRQRRDGATFPTRYPTLRLDYIFSDPSVQILDVRTVRTPLAFLASDHLAVVADVQVPSGIHASTEQ